MPREIAAVVALARDPVEADPHAVGEVGARLARHADRAADACIRRIHDRGEVLRHVRRRRSQRPGAGERRDVPVGNDPAARVSWRNPRLLRVGQRDRRVAHAERREDPLGDQLLVALPCFRRQRVSKKAHADVGVQGLRTR